MKPTPDPTYIRYRVSSGNFGYDIVVPDTPEGHDVLHRWIVVMMETVPFSPEAWRFQRSG